MPKKKIITTEELIADTIVNEVVPSVPAKRISAESVLSFCCRFWRQLLVAVLALALGIVSYLYIAEKNKHARGGVSPEVANIAPDKMNTEMSAEVLRAVSELMILPEEQDPIIATVADAPRLQKEQAFYQNAENGDMLLVFPKNRQAVIYRPSVHKIVNVGPLIIDQNEP